MTKGFTLIETIIYIGLFAIVIGGGMVATYQIIQSTEAGSNHVILEEEANFLLRKISSAMTGLTGITTPSSTTPTSILLVNNATGTISFMTNLDDTVCPVNYICFKRGVAVSQLNTNIFQLNSSSISVSNIIFKKTTVGNGITAAFTLTTIQDGKNVSENFSTTKYLRQ